MSVVRSCEKYRVLPSDLTAGRPARDEPEQTPAGIGAKRRDGGATFILKRSGELVV